MNFGFILCFIIYIIKFGSNSSYKCNLRFPKSVISRLRDIPKKLENDPNFQSFMSGPEGKKWKGTREILKRKNQIPDAKYSHVDVCKIVLSALQNNDEPQLDHGACVALYDHIFLNEKINIKFTFSFETFIIYIQNILREFKSPTGILASEGLDPAGYGRFLRSTKYSSLIDFKSFELLDCEVII